MSAPTIPQRPARSQHPTVPAAPTEVQQPRIPQRPMRAKDRSVSPNTDRYARSPLNDWSHYRNNKINGGSSSNLATSLPQRPPSVDLPSIGQEGNEYAALPDTPSAEVPKLVEPGSPTQFKAAGDIPMHQPKASVPAQVAKTRVSGVTRTDSDQAAAHGFGKPPSVEPQKQHGHGTSRSQSRPPSSAAPSRPSSIMQGEDEQHGIPQIGIQVPMYPNAGDVQAPTPSPYDQKPHSAGVGFFNDGTQAPGRRHERTKSGREVFTCPPGSYGLHGHGQVPRDQFEDAWYQRHPEELRKETRGAYGPAISEGRKEWALSSEDLNKLVREGNAKGPSMGTTVGFIGTPDEYVGYQASEEYASRMQSPRPASAHGLALHKTRTGSGTAHAESPLRKMSFPINEMTPVIKKGASDDHAMETEDEDEIIHVEPLSRVQSKYTGGGYDPPTEDLGPHGGNTEAKGGIIDEQGYGMPILASDEVAKRPGMEYLLPVIEPQQEQIGDDYYAGVDSDGRPIYKSGHSRPQSRNNSIAALQRFTSRDEGMHTPLEDVREYEPLFDEEDDKKHAALPKKPQRPDLARHHFPSKDIWEDTPSSLMYSTTVETPPADAEQKSRQPTTASKTFESPEDEEARKNTLTAGDREDFLSEHTRRFAKTKFNKDVLGDMPTRPGMQQRFPSQDIWEDTPSESMMTTVITPEPEAEQQLASTEAKKDVPRIPERPSKVQVPNVPPRPAAQTADKELSLTEAKKIPIIPDRPKPQIPSRPAKTRDVAESTPLKKTTSITSDGSADSEARSEGTVTEKRVPPPKPVKQFGGIKGGFISELQNKLQLGPQAPKKEVPPPEAEVAEEEKAPLADARKGRAKGPQRRKPGVSPSAAAAVQPASASAAKFGIVALGSVFEIDDAGVLEVGKPAPSQIFVGAAVETVPHKDPVAETSAEPEYFDTGSPETSVKHQAAIAEDSTRTEPLLPSAEMPLSEAAEAHHESLASQPEEPQPTHATEQATQTGQQDIEVGLEGEAKEKMTAYDDAHPQGGSVLTKEDGVVSEPKDAPPETS